MSETGKREGFSSAFGVLAATLGSAVGLGNIWMFPYQTGVNGGAGFLLIYLIATLIVGLPLMIAENSLGRAAHTDPVGVYRKLAPGTAWWLIGVLGVASVLLLMSFYSEVVGWVFAYFFKSATGSLNSYDKTVLEHTFTSLIANPYLALAWQWAALVLVGGILTFGVSGGIEAVTKRLMPILLILLILVAVRSLALPGAAKGVAFLFLPDFSKLNAAVVLQALGLAFFKLSLGVGSMTIYGSYFPARQNIPKTALTVMLADLTVSLLAGLAIFPAVFAFGFNPAGGPALLFQTIPAVFTNMFLGKFLMAAFFLLTSFAAIGAMLSLVEVPIAVLSERLNKRRLPMTWLVIALIAFSGSLCALSASTLAHVQIFGANFFDAFDFISSKILMPLSGILTSLFVGLKWKQAAFTAANTNQGTLNNAVLVKLTYHVLTKLTPLLILVVMVRGLWQTFFPH